MHHTIVTELQGREEWMEPLQVECAQVSSCEEMSLFQECLHQCLVAATAGIEQSLPLPTQILPVWLVAAHDCFAVLALPLLRQGEGL